MKKEWDRNGQQRKGEGIHIFTIWKCTAGRPLRKLLYIWNKKKETTWMRPKRTAVMLNYLRQQVWTTGI